MGRMKSLGYAYAEHLGDGVDVDWYFESIVNGEIEIPKWFVEEWMEANPIFASEDSEKDVRVKCTACPNGYIRDIPIQPTTMGKRVMCDTCRAVFFLGRPVYHDVGSQMRFDAETLTGICSWCDKNAQQLREVDYGGGGFICPTCHYNYRKLGYNPYKPPHPFRRKAETFESRGESGPSWPDDYEVIMTEIGHTIEKNGRVQVFGDVVFGLPNNRRSRISSFGTGSDKASARQALIDRATGYLIEEEQLHDYMTRNHLEAETREPQDRWEIDKIRVKKYQPPQTTGDEWTAFGEIITTHYQDEGKKWSKPRQYTSSTISFGKGDTKASAREDMIQRVLGGSSVINNRVVRYAAEGIYCEAGRHTVASDQIFGYDEDGDEICTACMNQYFGAETKSWRYQKRDASGRFAKGFQETLELADFMEMNPDEVPAVSETYTPEQVVAFINDCINDDDFPERMMDQVFLDSIQKVTAAADEELLEGLNAAANTALIEQLIYDDQAGIMGAKRAVFVTDVFLNFKWGQENWAAEDY